MKNLLAAAQRMNAKAGLPPMSLPRPAAFRGHAHKLGEKSKVTKAAADQTESRVPPENQGDEQPKGRHDDDASGEASDD